MNNSENSYSLSDTINWVSMIHRNQVRKGTEMPYVSHVFGVSALLMTHGIIDEDIIKTALLHDVVEDSDVTLEDIENMFSKKISNYVDLLSEDKSTSWEHRKQYSIRHIKEMPMEAKWVKLADKVNSLEMMYSEVRSSGIDWNKFNRGYVYQKWFYSRFFQEIRKDKVVEKSTLFKYGLDLLEVVFETNLGSKATYKKCLEKMMRIDIDSMGEEMAYFISRWKSIAKNNKEYKCQWYIKYASIEFRYKNVWYKLYPIDIGATPELFELLENDMVEDLVAFGAEDVFYTGMLD
jgi:hypothetical protein